MNFKLKNFKDFINESLNLKEPAEKTLYKDAMKNWNPSRYKELFQKYSTGIYKLDKSKTRIYFPLKQKSEESHEIKNEVISTLEKSGYSVIDYIEGQVVNPKKKIVSILVAFNTLGLKDLKEKYQEDLLEHKKADYYQVVISRLPYDIVGMSAHRRWSAHSCMNLYSHSGQYAEEYLPMDVKQGSLVAYLIRSEDKKILDPLARITIRPYIGDKESDIVFDNATRVYLDDSDNESFKNKNLFVSRVEDWILDVHESQDLNGIFQIKSGLYSSEAEPTKRILSKDFDKKVTEYYNDIKKFKEDEQSGLISNEIIIYMLDHDWISVNDLSKETLEQERIINYLYETKGWDIKKFDEYEIKMPEKLFKETLNEIYGRSERFTYLYRKFKDNKMTDKEFLGCFKLLDDDHYRAIFLNGFVNYILNDKNLDEYFDLFSKMFFDKISSSRKSIILNDLAKRIDFDYLKNSKYLNLILVYTPNSLADNIDELNNEQLKHIINYDLKNDLSLNLISILENAIDSNNDDICEYILNKSDVYMIKDIISAKILTNKWKSFILKKHPELKDKYADYFKGV